MNSPSLLIVLDPETLRLAEFRINADNDQEEARLREIARWMEQAVKERGSDCRGHSS